MTHRLAATERVGYLFAILTAMATGGAILCASVAVRGMEPATLGAIEFVLASVPALAWGVAGLRRGELARLEGRVYFMILLQATGTVVALLLLWLGLGLVAPTTAALLNRAEVLFTVAFGVVLLGERPGRIAALGGALAFAGVVVMRWSAPPELELGSLYILASALSFALGELAAKWLAGRLSARVFMLLRTPAVGILFLLGVAVHDLAAGALRPLPARPALLAAAGVALCGPLLARGFYFAALRRADISRVALINQSQPLFVALYSLLLLGEVPVAREVLGGMLVLAGTAVLVGGHRANATMERDRERGM